MAMEKKPSSQNPKRRDGKKRPEKKVDGASRIIAAKNPQSIEDGQPRCIKIAQRGVRTGGDFASLMAALMSDVIEGRVSAQTANAACNAGGKLLKIVDMQIKYATKNGAGRERELNLLNSGSTS